MKKRIISLVLCVVLVLSLLPATAFAATEPDLNLNSLEESYDVWDGSIAKSFAGGDGTESNPYIIETASQLALLSTLKFGIFDRTYYSTHYKLVNDLYLNDTSEWENWDHQEPLNVWNPIGSNGEDVHVFFDGNGHVISGLYINSTEDNQGLFTGIYHGAIENLRVEKSYIKGNNNVGGIVGWKGDNWSYEKIKFENCQFSGKVVGNENVGGLIGKNFEVGSGEVKNCINYGTIIGNTNVGGIAGGNIGAQHANINTCFNAGSIEGTSNVGGIAGTNQTYISSNAEITNCYNIGKVNGYSCVGGIVGYGYSGYSVAKECNCYNVGDITGNSYVGAIAGKDDNNSLYQSGIHVYDCYYIDGCAKNINGVVANGIGNTADQDGHTKRLSTVEMQQQASFVNWDFTSTWVMGGSDYPELIALGASVVPSRPDPSDFNEILYRADCLQDANDPMVQNINRSVSDDTPSEILVQALQESGFDESVAGWQAIELISDSIDDITALYDFAVEPKELYMGIILDALEVSVSYGDIYNDFNDAISQCDDFVSTIKDLMETEYSINILDYDLSELTDNQKINLTEWAKEWFEQNQPDLCGISDVFDKFSKGIKWIGTIESVFEKDVSYSVLARTGKNMEDVLKKAYSITLSTNNLYLQSALFDCIDIIGKSTDAVLEKFLLDETIAVGVDVSKYLIKEVLWKDVSATLIARNPEVAIFQAAYKGGKFVSNLLASTDDTIEKYYQMLVITDVESVIDAAYSSLKQSYLSNKDTKSAAIYLSALDLVFALRDDDCVCAYNFVDVLDQTFINKVAQLFGSDNATYAGTKSYIRTRQSNYAIDHEMALTGWIEKLDYDFPNSGLYEKYSQLVRNSQYRIMKKEFVVACPVNVYVYNQTGDLVASAVNGCISSMGDIMIAIDGDTKIIRFYDKGEYRIEYIGTDTGLMDITISEFDETGTSVRTVNFYDVALEENCEYEMDVDGEVLTEQPYELVEKSSDTTLNYNYDSLLSDEETYVVSVQSGSLIHNGEIFLTTRAQKGECLTINAYVPDEYQFVCWQSSCENLEFKDQNAISTSFVMPAEDVTIRAIFRSSSENIIPTTGISLNKNEISFDGIDKTETLIPTLTPENVTNTDVYWHSNSPGVATVDKEGVVTSVSVGTAIITVKTIDGGFSATCEVTVNDHEHNYDQQSADSKYLKSAATCTSPAVYYYSCECGEKGTETFEYGNALGHDWEYSKSGATITASCKRENCEKSITLTLAANDAFYDGKAYDGASTDDAAVKFSEKIGNTIGDIEYWTTGETPKKLESAPKDTGSYKAKITVTFGESQSITAEKAFTIKQRPVTLVAASDEKVYDGDPLTNSEFSVKANTTTAGYGFIGEEGIDRVVMTGTSTITNVGTQDNEIDTSKITAKDGTNLTNYAITCEAGTLKITSATATVPKAATGLVYTGEAQTGVEAGTGYTLTGNTATAAGNYTATATLVNGYKWSDNTNTAKEIAWTISPKDITGAQVGDFAALTYTGRAQTPSATVTVEGMTATGTWSAVTNVADKTTFTANGNFTGTITNQSTGMTKSTPEAPTGLTGTAPTTYGGSDGKITGTTAAMEYSTSTDFTFATDCTAMETTGLVAGTYYVRLKATDNTNAGSYATVTVPAAGKADFNITITDYSAAYDGQSHCITLTGVPEGATVRYGTAEGTYNEDSITYTDFTNGAKTVYVKVTLEGYNNFTGSGTVNITKASQTITAEKTKNFTYGNSGKSISGSTDGDGTISYAVKSGNSVDVDTLTGALTIKATGDTVITITAAETDNYKQAAKNVIVSIAAKAIDKPTAVEKNYTYDGNRQSFELTGFDGDTMEIIGNEQTDANESGYTVTVTPKNNYAWSTEGNCEFTWIIGKATPEVNGTLTGSGSIKIGDKISTISVNGKMKGVSDAEVAGSFAWKDENATASEIGEKTFKATFTPTNSNYKAVEVDVKVTVVSNIFTVTIPALTSGLTIQSIVNDTTEVENPVAGNYTVTKGKTFTITYATAEGYEFTDESEDGVRIATATGTITAPTVRAINYTITYVFTGVDDEDRENIANSNPKTYTVETNTITFADASCNGYTFTGWNTNKLEKGSTGNQTITGTFLKNVSVPTAKTELVYNGEEQTGVEAGTGYTLTGNTATAAGNYTATATLVDGYNWSDNTNTAKEIAWTISLKDITGASVGSFESLTYTGSEQTPSATVTVDGLIATGTWSAVTNVADKTTFTANGNFTGTIADKATGMAKSTPEAPTGLTGTAPTTYGGSNGKITGTTAAMEYSASAAFTFATDCTATETTGLVAGTYYVRLKATDNTNAGSYATVTVPAAGKADFNITITDYSAAYDGQSHCITLTGVPESATVKCGTAEGTYNEDSITYTDFTDGARTVYVMVTLEGYNDFTGSGTVNITKASQTAPAENEGYSYDNDLALTVNEGYEVSASDTFAEALTTGVQLTKNTTYYVRKAENNNHKPSEVTAFTATIGGTVKIESDEDNRNFGTATLGSTVDELIGHILTKDEQTAFADGSNVGIWLAVAEGNTPGAEILDAISAKLGSGYEIGKWLDIVLSKKVGNGEKSDVTELESGKIKIVIDLMDTGLLPSAGITRTYKIVRIHNGEVTILDAVFNPLTKKLTFETDCWSNYGIAYCDASGNSNDGGVFAYSITSAGTENGKITVNKKSASLSSTVTITVEPDMGFTLETLEVLDKNGKKIAVTNLGNNKYSFTMPSGNVTISATFMEDNTMLNFFVDVKTGDYFYDAVLWAAENGITKGTDAVHFSPDMNTTRAQVVTFLWRAAGCPEAEHTAAVFKDVPPDAYYVKAVEWALSEGITKGTSQTTFSPNAICTRSQVVAFLARFAGVEDTDTASAFTDVKSTDYFAAAVKWAKDNKVTEGTSATTFSPNDNCTRAQVVTFLYRWMVK